MKIANALLFVVLMASSALAAPLWEECAEIQQDDVRLYVRQDNGNEIYRIDRCHWTYTSNPFSENKVVVFTWGDGITFTNKDKAMRKFRAMKREYHKLLNWKKKNPGKSKNDMKDEIEKLKWRRVE